MEVWKALPRETLVWVEEHHLLMGKSVFKPHKHLMLLDSWKGEIAEEEPEKRGVKKSTRAENR